MVTTNPTWGISERHKFKPLSARRLEARSRARMKGVRTYVVEPERCYYTFSQSNPNVVYHQTREPEGWECECLGFIYTNCCKHLGQLERRSEREGWSFGRIARHDIPEGELVEIIEQ